MYLGFFITLMLLLPSNISHVLSKGTWTLDHFQPKTTYALATCSETVPSSCQADGCSNCKLQRKCFSGESQFTNCVSSEVCSSNVCAPRDTDSLCSCYNKVDGKYPDPYNPQIYITCVNKQENFQFCASNEIFSPSLGACFSLPVCTALGCYEVPDDCQAFYCCQKNGADFTQQILNCGQNEVYDEVLSTCVNLDPPQCLGVGPVVDPYKYNVYYICSAVGDTNPTPNCCASGLIYSTSTYSCIPDDGSSPNIGSCYSSQRETSYCS